MMHSKLAGQTPLWTGLPSGPSTISPPGAQLGNKKQDTTIEPFTSRAISPGFGSASVLVTVKVGEVPSTLPSARLLSPSAENVALRIASSRPVLFWSEATVKSQARYRLERAISAASSLENSSSKC